MSEAVAVSEVVTPSIDDILLRNHLEYDDAADLFWRLTVYEPFHSGWWFSNIGGKPALDRMGALAHLSSCSYAVDFCSGLGDAARYLAQRYGCRVTGIDLNARQIAQARERIEHLDPAAAGRVEFVVSDVLGWTPSRGYDLVYAMDALMYCGERERTVAKMREALRPGGLLFLAEVMAGDLRPDVAKFVWEEDGILHLPSPDQQCGSLAAAGFRLITVEDHSHIAKRCFDIMSRESLRYRDRLIASKGLARYHRWRRNAKLYRSFFNRDLGYVFLAAQAV